MIKYILAALACGVIAGYLDNNYGNVLFGSFISNFMFSFSLILLLFVMGFAFGLDKEAMAKIRKTGLKILIFPFSVALGSILGGLVAGLILNINVFASMAISAGFGWYTLAGPFVWNFFGAELGMLGFTVNFLRELLTIATISLTAKIDKYAPIALGGATTMDTTLPIIVRYCGSDTLITAFSSGFTLSIIAPFTIIAIATLK
ncbi:MAG: lysine exporter LysO family protein [Candidatus Bathyarchaeota archaeon]|nr:lysine exporter LysO family protein [Candidatus Bathyarchaeota archaeon]MDH5788210.1 lysine exporter LysO family protein [Candidatus Bathyarchaeota archaeon]